MYNPERCSRTGKNSGTQGKSVGSQRGPVRVGNGFKSDMFRCYAICRDGRITPDTESQAIPDGTSTKNRSRKADPAPQVHPRHFAARLPCPPLLHTVISPIPLPPCKQNPFDINFPKQNNTDTLNGRNETGILHFHTPNYTIFTNSYPILHFHTPTGYKFIRYH